MIGDPKVIVRRVEHIFQAVCFLLAAYFAVKLAGQYFENNDATSIIYRQYGETTKDKYPTFSICFHGTNFHWYHDINIFNAFGLSSSEYQQILRGQPAYRYEYNTTSRLYTKRQALMDNQLNANFDSFHVQVDDFLAKSEFVTENSKYTATYYGDRRKNQWTTQPPFYVGYQTPDSICFTRNPQDPTGSIRLYDHLSFNGFIFDNKMYEDTEIQLFVHYPKQLVRKLNNPVFSSSFSDYRTNKLLEVELSQESL